MIDLRKGDCLEVMKSIPNGSIDAIITDPPYGTTACKWDSVIDFELMWAQLNRIIKPNGAIVLFGSEPFSSALRMSNIKNYKYDWVWDKVNRNTGFGNVSFMPLKRHENIMIFVKSKKPTFNRQMTEGKPYITKRTGKRADVYSNGGLFPKDGKSDGKRNPISIIQIKADNKKENGLHPTQKPILLMEYLVRTYTNEGETVLDFTMGSGSTMVACQNTNRNGIGIEMDNDYFKIAQQRIKENEYKLF